MPDFGPPGDLIRANFAGEGERFYFHDALGSTTGLIPECVGCTVGNAPQLVSDYEYDPWGRQFFSGSSSLNRATYTSYREDLESELYYAIARYYHPVDGRFIEDDDYQKGLSPIHVGPFSAVSFHDRLQSVESTSPWRDTLRHEAGYPFAGNRPTLFVDPSGWYGKEVHIGLTHFLAATAGFSPSDAKRLGEACYAIDIEAASDPVAQFLHYTLVYPGDDWRSRRELALVPHFPHDPRIETFARRHNPTANHLVRAGILSGNLNQFGRAVHIFQDSWSHEGFKDNHGPTSYADKTWVEDRWKGRDAEMAQFVFGAMVMFLKRNPRYKYQESKPFPRQWVMGYLREDDLHAKEMMLRNKGFLDYARPVVKKHIRYGEYFEAIERKWRFDEFDDWANVKAVLRDDWKWPRILRLLDVFVTRKR